LTRFGGEIPHRSPKNDTGHTLRRSWGAFLVYDKSYLTNYIANNRIFRPENIDRAVENYSKLHAQGSDGVFSKPIPLTQYVNKFIVPEVPEDLKPDFPNGLRYGFQSAATGIYKARLINFNDHIKIQTKTFDGAEGEEICPRDRWQIQQTMVKLGANPIEPISA
jgi:hypothetical protein